MDKETKEILDEIKILNIQSLTDIIKIIKLNQKEVRKIRNNKKRNKELWDFHNGGISFGDVIIQDINGRIKRMQKEKWIGV